jgi:hypothetical protein
MTKQQQDEHSHHISEPAYGSAPFCAHCGVYAKRFVFCSQCGATVCANCATYNAEWDEVFCPGPGCEGEWVRYAEGEWRQEEEEQKA